MAEQPSLVKATLETLLRFLNWIPLGYIFETAIIETLRTRFLEQAEFRNVTMKCLTEIGGLQVNQYQYDEKLVEMFTNVMTTVSKIVPLATDLRYVYPSSNTRDQEFIQNLALFICNFFTPHLKVYTVHLFYWQDVTHWCQPSSLLRASQTGVISLTRISILSGYLKSRIARYSKSALNTGINLSRNCMRKCSPSLSRILAPLLQWAISGLLGLLAGGGRSTLTYMRVTL